MKGRDELQNYVRYIFRCGLWQSSLEACIAGLWIKYGKSRNPAAYYIPLGTPLASIPRRAGKALLPPFDLSGVKKFPSVSDQIRIRLATRTFGLQDFPAWGFKTDEPEDLYALHRFEWLLPLLLSTESFHSVGPIKTIISSWIDHHSQDHKKPGWDSYSISERCVNWLYFLSSLDASRTDATSFTGGVKRSLEMRNPFTFGTKDSHSMRVINKK